MDIVGMSQERVLHHSATTGTENAQAISAILKQLKFEIIQYPPYSAKLAPCHLLFFPNLKKNHKGTHFMSNEKFKKAVKSWIKDRPTIYFSDGIKKLMIR